MKDLLRMFKDHVQRSLVGCDDGAFHPGDLSRSPNDCLRFRKVVVDRSLGTIQHHETVCVATAFFAGMIRICIVILILVTVFPGHV